MIEPSPSDTDVAVPPELSCPLCLDLVYDPVSTPCSHVYCRLCISRVLATGHSSCPLCRRDISRFNANAAVTDQRILSLINASMPADLVVRRARENSSRLEIVVGNLYEEVPHRGKNSNKWTMYVSLRGLASQHASSLIDKVVYELHPTFKPSVVTAFGPTFGICRYGWGTFSVKCQVHWTRQLALRPTEVDHYLSFEEDGGRSSAVVDIDPEIFERLTAATQNESVASARGRVDAGSRTAGRTLRSTANRTEVPRARTPPDGARMLENVQIVVGNRCQAIPESDRTRWTMFVTLPEFGSRMAQMIDSVAYELHPTFNPRTVTCRSPSFELSRTGWGLFPVTCTIHWNRALQVEPTRVVHDLDFSEDGASTEATVAIRSSCLRRIR